MSDIWGDLTVADLEAMGISLEEFEQMLNEGTFDSGGFADFEGLGILPPADISSQATQWDVLDAQKLAREISRPPRPYERRQDRGFFMPNPDQFSYDAVNQVNPYLRALMNTAITEAGQDNPFGAREFVFGRDPNVQNRAGRNRTRIGIAVTEALPDFEFIAEEFHSDDPRWATRDREEQAQLLREWLTEEAEAALAGSAPSVSRNVNFSDWALQRGGEPFEFSGPGFDRAVNQRGGPRVELDPARWGPNRTEGMAAEMSAADFQRAYRDTLLADMTDRLTPGQRFEDPEAGGYWTIAENRPVDSPLERERRRQRERRAEDVAREARRTRRNPRSSRSNRSWWERNVSGPLEAVRNIRPPFIG